MLANKLEGVGCEKNHFILRLVTTQKTVSSEFELNFIWCIGLLKIKELQLQLRVRLPSKSKYSKKGCYFLV